MDNHAQTLETLKPLGDAMSIGATLAALIGALPAITTVLSFVWVCIRLYETKTVQKLLKRDRND